MSTDYFENQTYLTARRLNEFINNLMTTDGDGSICAMDVEHYVFFAPYFHQEFIPEKEDYREYEEYSIKNKKLIKKLIEQYKIRIKRLKKLVKDN